MRMWSLHPKYLDVKGLGGCWLETIIGKNALSNPKSRYHNHSALIRFKASGHPMDGLNTYLKEIYAEACRRNYNYNITKIGDTLHEVKIPVTIGQLCYEQMLLGAKLFYRDKEKCTKLLRLVLPEAHPIFEVIEGEVEEWERVKTLKEIFTELEQKHGLVV